MTMERMSVEMMNRIDNIELLSEAKRVDHDHVYVYKITGNIKR